jgi:hypothetical protein
VKRKICIEIVGSSSMGKSVFDYYLLWAFKTRFQKATDLVYLRLVCRYVKCVDMAVNDELISLYKYQKNQTFI